MPRPARPPDPDGADVWLDRRQLRVLAHPLRSRLLTSLRLDGPATATRLAGALGTNTGATSYHLRQLAEVGLVVEEPAAGRGRERWWRAAHATSGWWDSEVADDPDARAAADWLAGNAVRFLAEQAQHWIRIKQSYPRRWQDAAALNDRLLTLTPDRLRALQDDLAAVVQRYADEPDADEPDAEQVLIFVYGFPRGAGR